MPSPSLYKVLPVCLRLWGVKGNQSITFPTQPRLSDLRYLCQCVFMYIGDHIHLHVSVYVNDVCALYMCYCVYMSVGMCVSL